MRALGKAFPGVSALLVLLLLPACKQDARWSSYDDAGNEASRQGRYADAERLFASAIKTAEAFGDSDMRLATSLHSLGELYRAQRKYGFHAVRHLNLLPRAPTTRAISRKYKSARTISVLPNRASTGSGLPDWDQLGSQPGRSGGICIRLVRIPNPAIGICPR
jgi:hypothetical protein